MSVNPREFVWVGGREDAQQHAFTAWWQRHCIAGLSWLNQIFSLHYKTERHLFTRSSLSSLLIASGLAGRCGGHRSGGWCQPLPRLRPLHPWQTNNATRGFALLHIVPAWCRGTISRCYCQRVRLRGRVKTNVEAGRKEWHGIRIQLFKTAHMNNCGTREILSSRAKDRRSHRMSDVVVKWMDVFKWLLLFCCFKSCPFPRQSQVYLALMFSDYY